MSEPASHDAAADATARPKIGDTSNRPGVPDAPRRREAGRLIEVDVVGVGELTVEARLADGRPGLVDAHEFESAPRPGDSITVAVLARDDPRGRVWLSRRWARQQLAWQALREAADASATVTGRVTRVVKGGLVVNVGVPAFLPISLVDEKPPADLAALVGSEFEVAVVELDAERDRVVVSRRDVVRRERRQGERAAFDSISVGGRLAGTVKEIKDFGAFVDIGGVLGLVHRSELSWGRVAAVKDVLQVGDSVEVEVIEVNRRRRRVGLSIRRCVVDPLAALEVGAVASGIVTTVEEFGVFVRLDGGEVEGLVHRSELSELPGAKPDELFAPGDPVSVRIVRIDTERRRLGLSIRQALLGA